VGPVDPVLPLPVGPVDPVVPIPVNPVNPVPPSPPPPTHIHVLAVFGALVGPPVGLIVETAIIFTPDPPTLI
jgi:hypothetical protein